MRCWLCCSVCLDVLLIVCSWFWIVFVVRCALCVVCCYFRVRCLLRVVCSLCLIVVCCCMLRVVCVVG